MHANLDLNAELLRRFDSIVRGAPDLKLEYAGEAQSYLNGTQTEDFFDHGNAIRGLLLLARHTATRSDLAPKFSLDFAEAALNCLAAAPAGFWSTEEWNARTSRDRSHILSIVNLSLEHMLVQFKDKNPARNRAISLMERALDIGWGGKTDIALEDQFF